MAENLLPVRKCASSDALPRLVRQTIRLTNANVDRSRGHEKSGDSPVMKKILTLPELAERAAILRAEGRRLVLTNGCFDLLHVGHVRNLQQAAELGDCLAVAVNSDESVRALKGSGRPLNSQEDRAEVLAALGCVDFVTTFSELRAARVIEAVRPTIYVKGGDYTIDNLDPSEVAALESVGAEIQTVPLVPGKSTSILIEKMRS